jgi:NTE family protein
LDRLLEEPWLQIDAISGTSAGAMNAAVLADGWTKGGASGARAALDAYWERVASAAAFSPLQRTPLDRLLGRWTLDTSPVFIAFDLMSRIFSPYDLNPRGYNPLTAILEESIDFKRLARSPIKLFVTATNVHTGRGRIFRNAELTPDVLLASACLPTMFQAIEIDGEPYWDGGFAGNPTITPLVRESAARDTIPHSDQPARATGHAAICSRDPQSPERSLFQRHPDEGAAHDRAAAPGGRSWVGRGRAMGGNAHAPDHDRGNG